MKIAERAREKSRLSPAEMEEIIEKLCKGRFLTFAQIGNLVNRSPPGIRDRILSKMVQDGRLKTKYAELTHPDQAYTSAELAD